jgi:hypothetical protein
VFRKCRRGKRGKLLRNLVERETVRLDPKGNGIVDILETFLRKRDSSGSGA